MRDEKMKTNGKRKIKILSESELRALIAEEAKLLGLTFEDAVKRARNRTLPRTYIGDDLALLIELLPA